MCSLTNYASFPHEFFRHFSYISDLNVYRRFGGAYCLHKQGVTSQKTAIFVRKLLFVFSLAQTVLCSVGKETASCMWFWLGQGII
jgi:hypothetical protein